MTIEAYSTESSYTLHSAFPNDNSHLIIVQLSKLEIDIGVILVTELQTLFRLHFFLCAGFLNFGVEFYEFYSMYTFI